MTTPRTTPVPNPAQLFLPRTHLSLTPRQVLLSALPRNEALGCDPPDRALVNDIRALGVLQPVILVQTPAGGYTVADGRSRIWAGRSKPSGSIGWSGRATTCVWRWDGRPRRRTGRPICGWSWR